MSADIVEVRPTSNKWPGRGVSSPHLRSKQVTPLGTLPLYPSEVELTRSYERVIPDRGRERYEFAETRNAAAVLASTDPDAFAEVLDVLSRFELTTEDIIVPGGNKSTVARRLDQEFRELGWREAAYSTHLRSVLTVQPYRPAGERAATEAETESRSRGYKIDNVKRRTALDVEWNAKDGNLDRDVGAYRSFYDAGVIDGGIVVTRSQASIRALAIRLGRETGFNTTTTTTIDKLQERLARGDGGGCPILAVGITDRCYRP